MTNAAWEPLRRALWPLSFVYRSVTGLRNWCYDSGLFKQHALGVPVVSVGNLTVGGTGKTPLVVWLVATARAAGRRPGVLARGYGRTDGEAFNDEGKLLAMRFPDLPQVQDPDRVRGGRALAARDDVDLVILDDGLQHRRLARDTNIVCVDAVKPFAQGSVLPAGDLREQARGGLLRADVVVLTRADRLAGADAVRARVEQLRDYVQNDDLPVLACRHAPTGLVDLDGAKLGKVDELRGRSVVAVAAIARPDSFRTTLEELGATVADSLWFRDHHEYSAHDARQITERARALDATVVTTEKDAVKLRAFDVQAHVLRVDLDWIGDPPSAAAMGVA